MVHGQEAIRQSLAGEQAAEARRKAASDLGYYNLKLGPTAWNFDAGLSLEANDNIRYTSDSMSDLILRPEVGTRMVWQVSQKNSLNLALGAGYGAYMSHSEYSYFFVRPGSELSFDVYAGDFWINLHDRFSVTQDNYQDPTAVGVSDESRLENSIGLAATWDLNKIIVKSGYDHVSYISLGSGSQSLYYQSPDAESEVFSLSSGYLFRPEFQAGLQLGATFIHYQANDVTNQLYSDALLWNVGAYTDARLSEYMRLQASGGYMVLSPDFYPWAQDTSENGNIYVQLDFNHKVNQYLDYVLSGGRQIGFTYSGGTLDLYFVRWTANWRVFQKTTLSTGLNYEHGSQLYTYPETFDRIGPAISLNRQLTQKLTATLSYQFYWRGSDVPDRSYNLNMLTIGARYRF